MAHRFFKSLWWDMGVVSAVVFTFGFITFQKLQIPPKKLLVIEESTRSISSTGPTQKPNLLIRPLNPAMENLKLNCKNPHPFQSNASLIQIEFVNCGTDLEKMNVQNRSSGHQATLFQNENGKLITDFIQLKKGKNHLLINQGDGKKTELIVNFKSH